MTGERLSKIVVSNIVAARKARGWNQDQFARRLKKPASWLNRLETGKAVPTLRTLALLAKTIGCDAWAFLVPGKEW
jgi:transcriptional regulator with XRE-family HTH domain